MSRIFTIKSGVIGFLETMFSTSKYWDLIRPYLDNIPDFFIDDPSNIQKCNFIVKNIYDNVIVLKTVYVTKRKYFKVMSNGDIWLNIGIYKLNFSFAGLCSYMKRFQSQVPHVFFTFMRLCFVTSPSAFDDSLLIYKSFAQMLAVASSWLRIKKFEPIKVHELEVVKTWYSKSGLTSNETKPLEFFCFPIFFGNETGITVNKVLHVDYCELQGLLTWFDRHTTGKLDYSCDLISLPFIELDEDEDLRDNPFGSDDDLLFDTTVDGIEEVLDAKVSEVAEIREVATSALYKVVDGFVNVETPDAPEIMSGELETAIYKSLSIGENKIVEDTSLRIDDDITGVDIKFKLKELEYKQGSKLEWISTIVARKGEIALVVQNRLKGTCVSKRGRGGVGFDGYFQPKGSAYTIAEVRDKGDDYTYDIRRRGFQMFRAKIFVTYYIGILEPWPGPMQINGSMFLYDHWFDRYRYEWLLENDLEARWLKYVRWLLYEWRVKYGSSEIIYGRSKNLTLY